MVNFENISFHGVFRDYQQSILDNFKLHLKDNKIHIVAAPGSGKTILGLELIRRLGSPTIIFSPSITIRQQWIERFREKFIDSDQNVEDYVSYNFKNLNLINSVTYQSLYAALNKLVDQVEDDELNENETEVDYRDFELFKAIKEANIKTICLDEAHHLRSEWQRALEDFIQKLGGDITIISLTATPPYDSHQNEWNRYISLCGEIDEEIFIPELVAQGTLCPHQDYIYFNYPTKSESEILKEYKEKALLSINQIVSSDQFKDLILTIFNNFKNQEELILENTKEYIALLCLINEYNFEIPKGLVKLVSPSGKLPKFSLSFAEIAIQFIIDYPNYFTVDISKTLKHSLSINGLIDKKKVCFTLNDKLNKLIMSSMGKLSSISEIALSESKSLSKDLRLLILTDFVKKDQLHLIGTNEGLNFMGTTSIFESIRRSVGGQVSIGILSGSLIVVPKEAIPTIQELSNEVELSFSINEIMNTDYCEVLFKGNNKNKVAIITKVFEMGYIHILIGTKSLLGEGWDSPCINSLILASFVGSYMLSNQMRGRAIRIDRNNPNKTANIWHLATLEPQYQFSNVVAEKMFKKSIEDENQLVSSDYETLIRRFDCFLGPSYYSHTIESGIERLEIIKPPYNQNGIESINQEMLKIANDREGMKNKWFETFNGDEHPEILESTVIPSKLLPTKYLFTNIFYASILVTIFYSVLRVMTDLLTLFNSVLYFLIYITISFILCYFILLGCIKILKYISPTQTIKTLANCILNTLKEMGEIKSIKAKVNVKSDPLGLNVYCGLFHATVHEKNVFAKAMTELLTTVDNPRYLIIKKGLFNLDFTNSYACPSIIGVNKENAEIFKENMEKTAGKFELIYTRNELGRKYILKCRRWSYISLNEQMANNKKIMNSKWR